MHVMPAGVHPTLIFRRKRHTRGLLDRQAIKIRTEQHRRAFAVAEKSNNPVPADVGDDLAVKLPQLVLNKTRGFLFLTRQLRVRMHVFVEPSLPLRIDAVVVNKVR